MVFVPSDGKSSRQRTLVSHLALQQRDIIGSAGGGDGRLRG
jgi:hypothetical protein